MSEGTGAAMDDILRQRPIHPDTVRSLTTTPRVRADQAAGCRQELRTETGRRYHCGEFPALKAYGHWYCLGHINEHLCCGSKLLRSQVDAVRALPEYQTWQNPNGVTKSTDSVEPEQDGFDWSSHKRRMAIEAEQRRLSNE